MGDPSSGGNTKYGVIGLLFLIAAAGGIWFAMSSPTPPQTPRPEPPPRRSTKLVEPELFIPEPEPDAAVPDAGPRIRYVTRYVGGGDWECAGELDRAAAQQIIAQNRTQVRNCYERRLKVNNTLEGTLRLQLRIGPNGEVTGTRTSGGSLNDPDVFSCVRRLADRWRFPQPRGGRCAVVDAPFALRPLRE